MVSLVMSFPFKLVSNKLDHVTLLLKTPPIPFRAKAISLLLTSKIFHVNLSHFVASYSSTLSAVVLLAFLLLLYYTRHIYISGPCWYQQGVLARNMLSQSICMAIFFQIFIKKLASQWEFFCLHNLDTLYFISLFFVIFYIYYYQTYIYFLSNIFVPLFECKFNGGRKLSVLFIIKSLLPSKVGGMWGSGQ